MNILLVLHFVRVFEVVSHFPLSLIIVVSMIRNTAFEHPTEISILDAAPPGTSSKGI
jgi:hypothetical protein